MSDQNSLIGSKNSTDSANIYRRIVNSLCKLGLAVATVLLLACTALVGVNIIMRYGFHSSILGTEELVSAALTIIVMLSAPEVLRRHSHIGVDILVGLLPNRFKKIASIWSSALVLVVSAILIGVLTEGYIEIPVWTLQLFLPIGGLMMALVALEQLFKPQISNSEN